MTDQKPSLTNNKTKQPGAAAPAFLVTSLVLGVPLLVLFTIRSLLNDSQDIHMITTYLCFLMGGLTLTFFWRRMDESRFKKPAAILFTVSLWTLITLAAFQGYIIKEILFFGTILILSLLLVATLMLTFIWLHRAKKQSSTPILGMFSLALVISIFASFQMPSSSHENDFASQHHLQAKPDILLPGEEIIASEELIINNQESTHELSGQYENTVGEAIDDHSYLAEEEIPIPELDQLANNEKISPPAPIEHEKHAEKVPLPAEKISMDKTVPKVEKKVKPKIKHKKITKNKAAKKVHWSYYGSQGAQNWGFLSPEYKICHQGMEQSPINIPSSWDLVNPIRLFSRPTLYKVIDNGHTIQVDLKHEVQTYFENARFAMHEIDFHSPSEHLYDGKAFPMEAHFKLRNHAKQISIIAALIIEGDKNPELDKIWNFLPQKKNTPISPANTKLDLRKILPGDLKAFSYYGSLTTPPCKEGVRWYVLNNPIMMSKAQIQAFRDRYRMNARPTQPLYHRARGSMAH